MARILVCASTAFGLIVCSAWGQPRLWGDDFLTAAMYDSATLWAPCPPAYGGSNGPSTKYTMIEALGGDIYNDHAVSSGDGKLRITSRATLNSLGLERFIVAAIGVLDVGQPCPDNPGSGGSLVTSEPFTSPDVCMYGGVYFTPWHLLAKRGVFDWRWGDDLKPGIADVDDDLDGITDEDNESPVLRPTSVNNGYGHPGSNAYLAGQDGKPGIAGVDDDGNGTIDDYGEICTPGSDDGDDRQYLKFYGIMNGNFNTTSFVYLNIDPGTTGGNLFSVRSQRVSGGSYVCPGDELTPGFYQPHRHYNWIMCHSGTCWGAMLWTGTDMANPNETLGPSTNSLHTGANDNVAALVAYSGGPLGNAALYNRQTQFRGNSNFSDKFWVVSGPSSAYYPSPSADLDDDLDVDGFDFLTFSNCYNGSNKPPLAACGNGQADLDKDGDVDGFDFLTFSNCYNGSNRKPLAACFPPNLTTCGT